MLEDTDLKAGQEQMKLINLSNPSLVTVGSYSFFCRTVSMQRLRSLYLAEQVQLPPGPPGGPMLSVAVTKKDRILLKIQGLLHLSVLRHMGTCLQWIRAQSPPSSWWCSVTQTIAWPIVSGGPSLSPVLFFWGLLEFSYYSWNTAARFHPVWITGTVTHFCQILLLVTRVRIKACLRHKRVVYW